MAITGVSQKIKEVRAGKEEVWFSGYPLEGLTQFLNRHTLIQFILILIPIKSCTTVRNKIEEAFHNHILINCIMMLDYEANTGINTLTILFPRYLTESI